MHRRLGDADDWTFGDFPRRKQSRVAEAGDDIAFASVHFALAHFFQHTQRAYRFVVVAFNGYRAHGRANRDDLGSRRRHRVRRPCDRARHGFGCIRINDLDAHTRSLLIRQCMRRIVK